ncbi:MAG TPA: cobalt ECF transporter T component CbiQ [Anaerolineae bacterium]
MLIIDRFAYNNRLRRVDPAYKAALALAVLLICLIGNRPAVGLLAAVWMFILATALAGLPGKAVTQVLLAELFFLALASAGIALSVHLAAFGAPAGGWSFAIGPVAVATSPALLVTAGNVLLRTLGATASLNFLALTTPLVDLVALLRRLRVPSLLIDLMTVIYRFIFTLLETLQRIYTAQSCRLGYCSPRRTLVSAGHLGSQLFIDAYRRSQRLQLALDARGFDGELRVLPRPYTASPALLWCGILVVASLVIVRILA